MFCTVCGTQLRDGVKFCTKCGAKAKIPVMPQAAVPPQASVPPPPVYAPPAPAQKSAAGTVVAVIAVAAVLCVVGMLAFGGGAGNIARSVGNATNTWKGYHDFDSFSRAADVDELFGKKLTEEAFRAFVVLGILFSAEMQWDLVTGSKLTERYGVPESLRKNYNYLVKRSGTAGSTSRCACFNGEVWVVLSWQE
ncbi:MAG: hypothetical protein Pg6C_10490 [Treponemataceae bacterium]|nr:MAG: hypothetical protein Pg6C_10490 [Treponemataceae bacterium]